MKAKCIWLTGLPCSGKTTIAKALERHYRKVQLLDGDVIRGTPLANQVGFSEKDRAEHIKRMGHLAKMFVAKGVMTLCSFVSPSDSIRKEIATYFEAGDFVEIFVKTSVEKCIERDVKGMYAKALKGEIKNFTGIDAPYDEPANPDMTLDTEKLTLDECVEEILKAYPPREEKACLFIGRWNGIFHNGHDYIIQKKLDEGKNITMAVRDVAPDESNPWTASEVKEMLEYRFKDEPRVKIIIIPDLESVEYGRGVGYGVNEIKVDKQIAGISGTKCREMIANNDDSWKNFVPKEIVDFLIRKK